MGQRFLRLTADQECLDTSSPVKGHHNQVAASLSSQALNWAQCFLRFLLISDPRGVTPSDCAV
jgi:hypothetical protein